MMFRLVSFWYFFRSFLQRKIFISGINKNDLVLDVGSGDKPFWRADVIVDKYISDNQQRASGSVIFDKNKVFINADIEDLPFKDKAFDFVFCAHLLEHVQNPEKAIKELMRVAKKGYIEVPNSIIELFLPFPSHLWYCSYSNGILNFKQKENQQTFFTNSTETFGKIVGNSNIFHFLLAKYSSSTIIRCPWKGKVRFTVSYADNPYIYREGKNELLHSGFLVSSIHVFYNLFYFCTNALFYRKKKIDIQRMTKPTKMKR